MNTDPAHKGTRAHASQAGGPVYSLDRSRRSRPTPVGEAITSRGTPSLDAWTSCLPLGDLQAALLAALEPEVGRAA